MAENDGAAAGTETGAETETEKPSLADQIGGVFRNIGSSIQKTVSDIGAVGQQVVSTAVQAGNAALEGGKTLLTDPGQFASDVGNVLTSWGGHIGHSAEHGVQTVTSGFEDVLKGRSPVYALTSLASGMAQICSLGTWSMADEHLENSMTEVRDALGNVSGYDVNEGTDAVTRIYIERNSGRMATETNAEEEIQEALDEGDAAKARKLDSQKFWATSGKRLSRAAGTAAAVAGTAAAVGLAPATGGVSLGALAAAAGAAGTAGGMAAANGQQDFDAANVDDDVADRVDEDVRILQEAGLLSEAEEETYREIAQTVYRGTSYRLGGTEELTESCLSLALDAAGIGLSGAAAETGSFAAESGPEAVSADAGTETLRGAGFDRETESGPEL